jgi:hypothetical protein
MSVFEKLNFPALARRAWHTKWAENCLTDPCPAYEAAFCTFARAELLRKELAQLQIRMNNDYESFHMIVGPGHLP